ncbi:MAG: hypothetical protein ACRDQ5_10045 [Sciscionella sp.]
MRAGKMLWLPGHYRRLLHAVPDPSDYLEFQGVLVCWAACGVRARWWEGRVPPLPTCPRCAEIIGGTPAEQIAPAAPDTRWPQ